MLINFEPLKLEKCLGLLFRMTISGWLVVESRGQEDYQNKWVVLHEVKRGSLSFCYMWLRYPFNGLSQDTLRTEKLLSRSALSP